MYAWEICKGFPQLYSPEMLVVEVNVFDQFVEACDKANNPNAALLAAAEFTKESHVE